MTEQCEQCESQSISH